MMDQLMENPFLTSRPVGGGGSRRSWDVKEVNDALLLRMDMPGLGKEDVKLSVEQNTLIIKGEGEKESEDDESQRRYSSRLDLPEKLYNLKEIKAEMKNGVLKVVVPKVKEEERKDVYQVNIEWKLNVVFALCFWCWWVWSVNLQSEIKFSQTHESFWICLDVQVPLLQLRDLRKML